MQPLRAVKAEPVLRRISILGATGSIGQSTLKVIAQHPNQYQVEALVALSNAEMLAEQAKASSAKLAVIADEAHFGALKEALSGSGIEAAAGEAAVLEAMERQVDCVVSAIVGAAGLKPTLAAIRKGRTVALANKECLVCAGSLLMEEAERYGAKILPVDSEHNALYQVYESRHHEAVEKITLTASGGPFREMSLAQMQGITPEQAVKHPNWQMGAKISVDSATLMNKGLEVIEAFHLFPVTVEQIDVVIHPESIIHGLVHYVDGAVLAGLSLPDMATPIAYALAWPGRVKVNVPRLDLAALGQMRFFPVDHARFPALSLAIQTLKTGGAAGITLNAANEVAVAAFLQKRIGFLQITEIVAETLASIPADAVSSLDGIFAADQKARAKAQALLKGKR